MLPAHTARAAEPANCPPSNPTPAPPPRTATAARRFALILFALVASLLLINGLRMTTAGIADFQARAFLADWEAKSVEPSPRAWDVALQAATRATAHYPVANGAYFERLGYIYAWQHFSQPFGSPTAQASRKAARAAQQAAVAARPTWPYAWAALAEAKLNLLEFDAEFHHALDQALHYGPTRSDINRRVAEVGFIAWPQLSANQRDQTIRAAARAIAQAKRHRARIFALASTAGQQTRLCNDLGAQAYLPSAQECPLTNPQ